VLAAVFAVALVVATDGGQAYRASALIPSSSVRSTVSARTTAQSDNLRLVVDGVPQTFANGGVVNLGENLVAQITIAGSDAGRYRRDVSIAVTTNGRPVQPVDGLAIQANAHMLSMSGEDLAQMAVPVGSGHYLLPLQLTMSGEWQIDLNVTSPQGQSSPVRLDLQLRS